MPKIKTKRAAKKRFKITGSGKIMHLPTNKSHILEWKTSSKKRRLSKAKTISPRDRALVRSMLPGT